MGTRPSSWRRSLRHSPQLHPLPHSLQGSRNACLPSWVKQLLKADCLSGRFGLIRGKDLT
ncbi:hypothetical protein NOCA2310087 [metagenome]|uniref:Uncharacterized protein n=1 Tax=metagenome TaxID=256318 RepID=A0A2P2C1R3_9ZZZZ